MRLLLTWFLFLYYAQTFISGEDGDSDVLPSFVISEIDVSNLGDFSPNDFIELRTYSSPKPALITDNGTNGSICTLRHTLMHCGMYSCWD